MHDIVDKFSTHLKNVLTKALVFAVEQGQPTIQPEHLLWSLGTEKGCLGSELLHKLDVTDAALRQLVNAKKAPIAQTLPIAEDAQLHLSEDAKRILEKAVLTATIYGHQYIGTEHLLSGMLQVSHPAIDRFFAEQKTNLKELREQISLVLKSTSKFPELTEQMETQKAEPQEIRDIVETDHEEPKKTPALDFFGRDLTTPEIQQDIDPVIGRDNEIQRMMEILCRRTKNNPLLLGEPGVGKTAIVEGLAKRVLEGTVPPALQNKRIVALDLAIVIAGTMYRGEFEGRLRQIIDEVRESSDIILFIDEIHTIVGAGAASGSLDAANMLKPALARGEIRCIGATTLDEYKKHIETDTALERRFQTIHVDEPTKEKTIEILSGIAPLYESFHGVRISPMAIEQAVLMSSRYIQDKRLPDKAIDLLDEAAASARVQATDPGPIEQERMKKKKLEAVQEEKRQAVVEERFLDAIGLKQEEERLKQAISSSKGETTLTSMVISERDIAQIVSRSVGIPVSVLMSEAEENLAQLDDALHARVIGQERAVSTAAAALRRAKTGISHPSRPLASLLFLGPSGVGKTELAKAIAEEVFHDPKALIRLDMSEYAEGFTMSKLIGAPAGYVGYREHAKLTDAIKRRPYSVVLFDELEKAHKDVQNLLLQLLEEGEVADATGRKVNFKNTIVIMTSNVGLERFSRGGIGFTSSEAEAEQQLKADLSKELEERFRPELVNRIDHVCVFRPLSKDILSKIVEKELEELVARMQLRGTELLLSNTLTEHILASANLDVGARDIRRQIQSIIENPIADRLIKGDQPQRLAVNLKNGKIVVTRPRQKTG